MQSQIEQVAQLLAGGSAANETQEEQQRQELPEGEETRQDPPQEGEPGTGQEEEGAGDDSPKGQDDEQKNAALDYNAIIPLGNGREATLGGLKDAFQAAEGRELDLQGREAAILRQRVELDELLYNVIDQLPPQLRQGAAHYLSEQHARAASAVLEVIPQWREETARRADFGLIEALAKEYGLEAQIGHQLKYPTHPGTLQLLRDFARLRDTVRKAGGKLKAAQTPQAKIRPSTAPRQDQGKNLIQRAKQSGKTGDQIAAVAHLLRGN